MFKSLQILLRKPCIISRGKSMQHSLVFQHFLNFAVNKQKIDKKAKYDPKPFLNPKIKDLIPPLDVGGKETHCPKAGRYIFVIKY